MSGKASDNGVNSGQAKMPIAVLGAGCAALSLAARSNAFSAHQFTIIDPETHVSDDHIWGFWAMPWLSHVTGLTRKTWHNWRIISPDLVLELSSKTHPYCALSRHEWLNHCRQRANDAGVSITNSLDHLNPKQILDSRPPKSPPGALLQHFLGYEITSNHDVFNPDTAILMDFRCDQSRGVHFIYYLPFTQRRALVESTLFSPSLVPKEFYDKAIKHYLANHLECKNYTIKRREQGVIPMASLQQRDPDLIGIGANGGAIRPSSGYAFSFIQKQIDQISNSAKPGKPLQVKKPHSRFELMMDQIFLKVIRRQPTLAPVIFTSLARYLNGDEFACFLSGEASMRIWLKVVFAMPKWPFLFALLPSPTKKYRDDQNTKDQNLGQSKW
jgi:lycopene beta-cyclase